MRNQNLKISKWEIERRFVAIKQHKTQKTLIYSENSHIKRDQIDKNNNQTD